MMSGVILTFRKDTDEAAQLTFGKYLFATQDGVSKYHRLRQSYYSCGDERFQLIEGIGYNKA